VTSQTQLDGHVRKTAGTGGAAGEIESTPACCCQSPPSAAQIAAIAADGASVTRSVKSFVDTSRAKCSCD
jgi:hypothetical protein